MALTPKKIQALEERFDRVRELVTKGSKKPRYDSILTVTTLKISDAQPLIEEALDQTVKRWTLNQVATNVGKPSELYYLLRIRKSCSRDELLTAIRTSAGDKIDTAEVEVGVAVEQKKKA